MGRSNPWSKRATQDSVQIKIRVERSLAEEFPQIMQLTGCLTYTSLFQLAISLLRAVVEHLARVPGGKLAILDQEDSPVYFLVVRDLLLPGAPSPSRPEVTAVVEAKQSLKKEVF